MPVGESIVIPVIYEDRLDGLIRASAEIEKVRAATEQLKATQQKAFTDSAQSVSNYAHSLQEAAAENQDFAATTKEANRENGVLAATLKENVRGLNLFGFNVGEVIDNLQAKRAALRGVVSGLQLTTNALRILKVALISTGIGALVVAIGSLIALLTKSERGMQFVERALTAIGAAANVVIDRAVHMGDALVKATKATIALINLDFKGFAQNAGEAASSAEQAFSGFGDELVREVGAAYELKRAMQELEDQERELGVEYAKKRAAIEGLRDLAADETKSFNARTNAAKGAISTENELEEKRLAIAQKKLDNIRKENELRKDNLTDAELDKEAQAIIELENIRSESARRRRRDVNFLQALLRQQAALAKQLAEEERKRLEEQERLRKAQLAEYRKLSDALSDQIEKEELLTKTERERLETQRINAIEALEAAERELVAKAVLLGREREIEEIRRDFARLRALTNDRFEREITKVVEAENQKRLEADRDRAERSEKVLKTINSVLERRSAIEQERIDLLKKSADAELSLEQYKEQQKLLIQKRTLEKQRENLLNFGASPVSLEVQELDNDLALVSDKLAVFESLPILERIKNKFKDMFNLSEEDLQEIGDQLGSIVNNVFAGFSALIDAQISKQDAIIDKQREVVSDLERQLEVEKELREKGVANDFDALNAKLTGETELLKKEEEKRLALEKKAAQLRLRQEALQVASNIALSVAKVIAAESNKGLLGIVTAVAAVASIFALIAKSKAQAAAFAKPDKLRKGARLEGATHERGGIPVSVDGKRMYEAEKGEWLIGTKPSQEHNPFLERLNNNEFAGMDLNRHVDFARDFYADPEGMITNLAPQYGIPVLPDLLGGMLPGIRKSVEKGIAAKTARQQEMMVEAFGMYFNKVEGGMSRVEKAIKEQTVVIPITPDGYMLIETKGNTKTLGLYDKPIRKSKK